MKRIYLMLMIGTAFISLNSCKKVTGDGPIVSEERTVSNFSEIEFEVPGDIIFIDAPEREITIAAQRNIINVIETYVTGNELKVKVRDNTNIGTTKGITITVKGPGVRSLKLSGSGSLSVPGTFAADDAKLRISGSGTMMVSRIQALKLEARISGSGNIDVLEGTVENEDLNISGSGNLDLAGVTAKKASTQTSGSGTMKVNVTDELEVRISGSGDVYYLGSPTMDVDISGSGKIRKL